ncbi:hypothetical protein EV383_5031 [Pseudonocardia sediminis]|uniref:PE family protein n=1 Tax=Pseudonocardia sediminis TaxID=1397368 RepID=A0A4Q7V1U8_PSEST|nr:hypothetical protein [Pseudonocardia sediminis]RZT88095.1 hypothetical protein EV383_5031 [Pseudonocardia sediminis]
MAEIVNPHLRGAVDHLMTQVTPENVLGVRKVLLQEVRRLRDTIDRYENPSDFAGEPEAPGRMGTPASGFRIGRCSDDPVSGPAQISFQRKIDAVVGDCKRYVADLNTAAEGLKDVARRYSLTEEQIEQSFESVKLRW